MRAARHGTALPQPGASPELSGDATSETRFSSSFRGSSLTSYFAPFVCTPKSERRRSPRDSPPPRSPCGLRRAGPRPAGRGERRSQLLSRPRRSARGAARPRPPPAPPPRAALRALSTAARPLTPRSSRRGPPRAAVALRRGPFSAGRARGRRRCQAAARRTPTLLHTRPEPGRGAAEGRAAARRGGSGASGRKALPLPAETPRRHARRPGLQGKREEGTRQRGRAQAATHRRRDATVAYRPQLGSAPLHTPTTPPGRAGAARPPLARRPHAGARQGQAASPGAWRRERSTAPPARPPPHPAPRAAPPPPRAAAAPRSARVLLPRTSLAASGERLLPLAVALREVGRRRRAIGRASCVYTRHPPIRGASARGGAGRKGGPQAASSPGGLSAAAASGAARAGWGGGPFGGLGPAHLPAAAAATERPPPVANAGRGVHGAARLRRSSSGPGPTRQRSGEAPRS